MIRKSIIWRSMYSHYNDVYPYTTLLLLGKQSSVEGGRAEAPQKSSACFHSSESFIPNCGTTPLQICSIQFALYCEICSGELILIPLWLCPLVFWSWMNFSFQDEWVTSPCLLPVSLKFRVKTIVLTKSKEITWVILNLIFDWESDLPSCFSTWQTCSYVMKELFDNKKNSSALPSSILNRCPALCNLMDCSH